MLHAKNYFSYFGMLSATINAHLCANNATFHHLLDHHDHYKQTIIDVITRPNLNNPNYL